MERRVICVVTNLRIQVAGENSLFSEGIGDEYKVEREMEKKIKILRTDNGGEYVSGDFKKFLESEGIQRHLTVEYTPQQNGVAERANRTLVEMARCMLMSSNLPESLWGEAINTAAYLRNRSPTKLLQCTPYEAWCGNKPSVHHLRIFGSKAIVLNKRPGKSKFAAKSYECFIVGYSPESKAYRLYDPATRQIIKSRDLKFLEDTYTANIGNDVNDYTIIESMMPEEANVTRKPTDIKILDENDDYDVVFDDAVGEVDDGASYVSDSSVANDDEVDGAADGAIGGAKDGADNKVDNAIQKTTPARRWDFRPRKKFNSLSVSNPSTVDEAMSRGDADL